MHKKYKSFKIKNILKLILKIKLLKDDLKIKI